MNDWYAASGTYAIMVGNASDSISEEVQIQFNASRCLPISIAGDTTVGELMSDPRTAKVIDVLTKNFANSNTPTHSEEGEGPGASEEQMNQAMMMYMPLKSMQSFLPISDEQLESIFNLFRDALKN